MSSVGYNSINYKGGVSMASSWGKLGTTIKKPVKSTNKGGAKKAKKLRGWG